MCVFWVIRFHSSHQLFSRLINHSTVKRWSNGLASQCKFSICVWLAFHLATLLCWLGKSTQVFHRLATQHKSTQVDHKSTVYVWNLRTFRLYGLRELASRLANPFGHHSQVRLVLQTCANLRWLESPFGQGSKPRTSAATRFPRWLVSNLRERLIRIIPEN